MKSKVTTLLALLAISASTLLVNAQDAGGPPDGQQRPRREGGFGGPGGPGGPGGRRPIPPVITALDANHDGTIDESEIANASAALKTLDKNGDGKLTQEELRPPRPEGPGPGPDGENRPRGPRGGGDKPHPPGNE